MKKSSKIPQRLTRPPMCVPRLLLKHILHFLQAACVEVEEAVGRAHQRMVDATKQRFHAECGAASAVASVASEAALSGHLLTCDLRFEVPPCKPPLLPTNTMELYVS